MPTRRRFAVVTFLGYSLSFSILWWVLTAGARDSWTIGAIFILLATFIGIYLLQPTARHFSITAFIRFVPYFISESFKGGIVVVRGAFHTPIIIQPHVIEYRTQLPPGRPRAWLTGIANLLPGTLVMYNQGEFLHVHVFDKHLSATEDMLRLERHIAHLFRIRSPGLQEGRQHG